jgi:hypothetical protein
MIENGEPAEVSASSTAAPSCYRVSVLSGSLEISARLKDADDLELLMRVLEANKALFTKADKLEPEIDRPATKLSTSQSETQALAKADRPKAKTKANGSARKFLTEVDRSEDEILTLT